MPLIAPGIYARCDDIANEAETTYYLRFHIKSALISLHMISNYSPEYDNVYGSKAQFYHYYSDHLLYSLGQIAERFRLTQKPSAKEKEYYERRKINRKNYHFTDTDFPILSNKDFRNTIEHIDEHNITVINAYNGVGGFNYIDDDTSEELVNTLLSQKHNHIYTLDMRKKVLYITRHENELELNLTELTDELNLLMDRVNSFASYIDSSI